MAISFDFEDEGRGRFGSIYRPVAKVSLQSSKFDTWINTWMVIDTGADFTILPKYISADLGISLEHDCILESTKGVGGEQTIYFVKSKITAKIGSLTRKIPLAFFATDELPPLLGRLGFLETFDTEFLAIHKVTFKDPRDKKNK